MSIYQDFFLNPIIHKVCSLNTYELQRKKIVKFVEGDVLELGVGTGLNFPHIQKDNIGKYYALDTSKSMLESAAINAKRFDLEVEFILSSIDESIPIDDSSVDTVLFTYVMCSVKDMDIGIRKIKRVLKPGGKVVFCEHGLSPEKGVARIQNFCNPLWRPFAGGCNLNRNIELALVRAGFKSEWSEKGYISGWKPGSYNYWGVFKN